MGYEILHHAKSFATLHHVLLGKQLYGPLPYTHHLAAVEGVLRRFGVTYEPLLVAAWLHDVVEDTDVKLRDVEETFGEEVAALVGAVTNEPGSDRKTRHLLTYPKIRKAGVDAVTLKLADRIANVEAGGSMLKKYRAEHADFREALYTDSFPGSVTATLWNHLDALLAVSK